MLSLSDKMKFKMSDKYVALSNLSMHYTCKNMKNSYKSNKLKISAPNLNYLMGHIQYHTFKLILSISPKSM